MVVSKPGQSSSYRKCPPFSDLLVCAVSSQVRHECNGFDEIVATGDDDFLGSGLKVSSLIRLGIVATIPRTAILGELGVVSSKRLKALQARLAAHIKS